MKKLLSFLEPNFIVMVFISVLIAIFLYHQAHAKDVRTLRLSPTSVARVFVSPGRSTILSFPIKPTKVILGNQSLFAIEYVENDLAVAALSSRSHSDLFVYLEGRRFAFDLAAIPSGGDTIILVRDFIEEPKPISKKRPIKIKEKRS